ncbi:MAG: biopolymer transporter ExbD [Pseudomonadota bacterium]|nr:biopolymer transporter ExbD [Pseudomonadota bacterium]
MRRARKSINQINVVPYIDVMLVLLIIFMVTAPLINPGEIQLPSVGTKLSTPVSPLEITIVKSDLTLLFREAPATPVKMSRDDIIARIHARQKKNPDQAVVIYADGSIPYKAVMGVLDMLQTNGVSKVGLMARSSSN